MTNAKATSSREAIVLNILKKYDWDNLRHDILKNLDNRSVTFVSYSDKPIRRVK